MKIFRIALQTQMLPTTPGNQPEQNLAAQIPNFQQAIPILQNFSDIVNKANQLYEMAANLGNDLGMTGLADQVIQLIQGAITNNPDFQNLITMQAIGSIDELFKSGFIALKITEMNKRLQAAQQVQASMEKANQSQ